VKKKHETQDIVPRQEPPKDLVGQTDMIPTRQVEGIVAAAVKAALETGPRAGRLAQQTAPGRDAEDDIRLVLRTADFLLRAVGIKMQGAHLVRADGAFYSDPSMIEGYRMLKQLMRAYNIVEEPVEFVKHVESPETFTDEFGVTHRTPHVDPYGDDGILDHLEGGWGRTK